MSNNIYNISKIPSMPERVLSALAYLSFGIIGIILLILSAILKIGLKPFVKFNVYQSILLGFVFGVIQITYDLISSLLELLNIIPFLGVFINSFFQFLVYYLIGFPVFLGLSLLATATMILILYLMVMAFMGKVPYIPLLSNAIKRFL